MAFFLRNAPKNGEAGFTLFEVLAAFALFSLFLSRFVPALVQLRETELQAVQKAEAYLLGYGKLQEILCQAERRHEGSWAKSRYHYTWSFNEEKSAALLSQTLTVKWKDLGYERKVQLHKIQLKED
jgi:type II secretory pathway component PulJ